MRNFINAIYKDAIDREADAMARRNNTTDRRRTFPLDDSQDYYEGKMQAFQEITDRLAVFYGATDDRRYTKEADDAPAD